MARTPPTQNFFEFAGNLVTSEYWNEDVKGLNDFLSDRPMFRASCTTAASIPTGTNTPIPFDTNWIDTDSGHNTQVNNSRYTCQVSGIYWVKGCVAYTAAGVATRVACLIAKNGSPYLGGATFLNKLASDSIAISASGLIALFPGDYIEIWTAQISGGSLTLDQHLTGVTESDFNVLWLYLA